VHHSTRLSESDKEEFFSNVLGVEKGPDSEICRKAKKQCWGVPARDLFKSANAEKEYFTAKVNQSRSTETYKAILKKTNITQQWQAAERRRRTAYSQDRRPAYAPQSKGKKGRGMKENGKMQKVTDILLQSTATIRRGDLGEAVQQRRKGNGRGGEKEKISLPSGSTMSYKDLSFIPEYILAPPGVNGVPNDIESGSRIEGWPECKEGAIPSKENLCKPMAQKKVISDMALTFSKITLCKKLAGGGLKCSVRKIIYACFVTSKIDWYGWELSWELKPYVADESHGASKIPPNNITVYDTKICEGAPDAMWVPHFLPHQSPFKTEATTTEYACSALPAQLVASAVV